MARGTLRIYLGAAPGVGKTFAMLDEGYRRAERGTDVVVAYVETHNRPKTAAQIRDLEVVPRGLIEYRGQHFEEMDIDRVLERRPQVALVDELAHTNVPGSRNAKRYEDVDEILAAGIDVISTVNIQHLESLNDVVEQITGIVQRETIPDAVVRAADQVELVDMTPEALRRRMAHGNIYAAEKIDSALGNYFRVGNLTALRELALLWVADQVDAALADYRDRHGIAEPWETRERVAVALTGAPGADDLIRRAARIATRSKAELIGIHVERSDGLASSPRGRLDEHRKLLTDLGGRYRAVVDNDIGRALVNTAMGENATQLVLGASRRSRWTELTQGSVVNKIAQEAGGRLDIHIIATSPDDEDESKAGGVDQERPHRVPVSHISRRRQLAGLALTVIGLPLLTAVLVPLRERMGFASEGFCYLLAVVGIGTVGGAWVAALAALLGFVLLNYFFAEPVHTFTITNERDAVALVAFLVVAGVVSFLVERAARQSADATRARAEAETLATMAGLLLRDDDPLTELVGFLESTFELDGVSVLRRLDGRWCTEAAVGPRPPAEPSDATLAVSLGPEVRLALNGGQLRPDDRRVIDTFSTQLALALEHRHLQAEAAQSAALAKANDLRTAVLAAVSHDLRTPLTTIKTSASSLLDREFLVDEAARQELLETIDEEADRLNQLVGDLLDLGRIEADAVHVTWRATDVGDAVAAVVTHTPHDVPLSVEIEPSLPAVRADPVLLERALANLVANAAKHSPPDRSVTIRASIEDEAVEVRVIDHGPGIPRSERRRLFQPFQRLEDSPESAGVGLGLAVARGFVEVMDGALTIDETPGGGTTMICRLQVAQTDLAPDAGPLPAQARPIEDGEPRQHAPTTEPQGAVGPASAGTGPERHSTPPDREVV